MTEMKNEDVLNLDVLKEFEQYGEDGASILIEAISLYLEDSQLQLNRLDASVKAMDGAGIERAAHSLRGSSATLGATRLAELCNALEDTAAKGIIKDAHDLLTQIDCQTAEVQLALKTQSERLQANSRDSEMMYV